MKVQLAEAIDVRTATAGNELYDGICEALKQVLRDTLARIAQRDSLEQLLAQVAQATPALQATTRLREPPAPEPMLTAREREILQCIARGDSNKAIARTFDLSVHTVKRHVANILGKLGVSSRVQAATWLSARH
jgi:two-component system, NarL family, nitrate/nitrite response regulator NarL